MDSAFHLLLPRYRGTLTSTAPTAIRLWDTFTFLQYQTVFRGLNDNDKVTLPSEHKLVVYTCYSAKMHFTRRQVLKKWTK